MAAGSWAACAPLPVGTWAAPPWTRGLHPHPLTRGLQVALICKELGQSLELRGENEAALQRYEQCRDLESKKLPDSRDEQLLAQSRSGMCRTLLRLGQVRRGVELAVESENPATLYECGVLLESMKHMAEAADM